MPKKPTKKKPANNELVKEILMPNFESFADLSVDASCECCPSIEPLTQEFGNGELNILRDKINEIIAKR